MEAFAQIALRTHPEVSHRMPDVSVVLDYLLLDKRMLR